MKKRWILCTVAVLCIAAALLGCGKKNVGTPEDNAVVEEDDKKNDNTGESGRLFGFSGIDMSNPFYDTLKNSVQTALEAQGDRLMVRDPASDADLQNEQIRELINEGVQAVFLCPVDWEKITPALEALKEADIPVINLDTEVKETSLVSAFVGSDNENAGYVCGQDLLVQKPDGGKIVIVENPGVNSVNERITGFEEAITNSGFEVVKRIEALGDSSNVKDEMTQVLSENSEIDAVMCGSAPMAEQVMAAITEAQRTNICVYSVDGSPATKTALVNGTGGMTGIGAQSPINMGKTAVKVATALLADKDYEKDNYEETFFINRDNVEMYGTDGWQ